MAGIGLGGIIIPHTAILSTRLYTVSLSTASRAGAVNHFYDLLLGHFYFPFVRIAVGELAAVGDGAVGSSTLDCPFSAN